MKTEEEEWECGADVEVIHVTLSLAVHKHLTFIIYCDPAIWKVRKSSKASRGRDVVDVLCWSDAKQSCIY